MSKKFTPAQKGLHTKRVNQLLSQAQAIISHGWAQATWARNASGLEVGVRNPTACKFCMLGATERAEFELGFDYKVRAAANKRLEAVLGMPIEKANDKIGMKKERIFDVFTLAILGAP